MSNLPQRLPDVLDRLTGHGANRRPPPTLLRRAVPEDRAIQHDKEKDTHP